MTVRGCGAVSLRMEKRSHAVIRVEGGSFSAELSGSSSLNLESACEEVSLSLSANSSCVTGGSSGVFSLSAKGTSRSILNGSAEEVRYTLSGSTDESEAPNDSLYTAFDPYALIMPLSPVSS